MVLQKSRVRIYVFLSVILALFVKFWEPGLGLSSTTYGAFAQNILNGQGLFHFNLAPGVFDPFIDHPPFIIWLQALFFKFFGVSAQVLRLPSILLGLGVFVSLYAVVKKNSDERGAIWSVLSLLLINTFMNFTNSGWLDMGMVGFTWLGFASLYLHDSTKGWKSWGLQVAGSLFLSLALLSKGLAAMALLPITIYFLFTERSLKKLALWAVISLGPIGVFTWMFYRENGHVFWMRYLEQRALNAAQMESYYGAYVDRFWYLKELFLQAHFIFLFCLLGLFFYFKKSVRFSDLRATPRALIFLIIAEVFLHCLIYSQTNREYNQYLVPSFPWIALGSGLFLSAVFNKYSSEKLALRMFVTSLLVFLLLAVLPVTVHNGENNEYRHLAASVKKLKGVKGVRIPASMKVQHTWEGDASFVVWYWELPVKPVEGAELFLNLQAGEIVTLRKESHLDFEESASRVGLKKCFENHDIVVLTEASLCTEDVLKKAPDIPFVSKFGK